MNICWAVDKQLGDRNFLRSIVYLCLIFVLNKTYINYNGNSEFLLKQLICYVQLYMHLVNLII